MIIDDFRHGKSVSIEVKDNREKISGNPEPQKNGKQKASVPALNGKRDHTHIDLGLAILCSKEGFEKYGSRHTLETISAFCGCSRQAIERIEKKAMRKVRSALYRDKTLEKDLKEMFGK